MGELAICRSLTLMAPERFHRCVVVHGSLSRHEVGRRAVWSSASEISVADGSRGFRHIGRRTSVDRTSGVVEWDPNASNQTRSASRELHLCSLLIT